VIYEVNLRDRAETIIIKLGTVIVVTEPFEDVFFLSL
jgi:hypothetical protein